MKYPIVSSDAEIQARYVKLRKEGAVHFMAELLACQQAPRAVNTYSPLHPRKNRGRGF